MSFDVVLRLGGSVEASINPVGASMRSLQVEGEDLIQPYLGEIPPLMAGVVMLPWPNRIDRGEWVLDGETMHLPVNETDLNNAIHGLLYDRLYRVEESDERSATLTTTIDAIPGYPFTLDTTVRYRLTPTGVEVTHGVRNRTDRAAPVGLGVHPYLRCGAWSVDHLEVQLPADSTLLLDERHLPSGSLVVAGTDFDLNQPTPVADAVPHAAYTNLATINGRRQFRLLAPDDSSTIVTADHRFRWAQFYVVPDFPGPDGDTWAVTIEPMTAPPNSLATGTDLKWLAPGETWMLNWSITSQPAR